MANFGKLRPVPDYPDEGGRHAEAIKKYGRNTEGTPGIAKHFVITDPELAHTMLEARRVAYEEYPELEKGPLGPADVVKALFDMGSDDIERVRSAACVNFVMVENFARCLEANIVEKQRLEDELESVKDNKVLEGAGIKKEVWN